MTRFIFGFLIAFLSFTGIAIAEPITPIAEIKDGDMPFDLIGGRLARDGELPVSVFIGNCTATAVGPKVVLTAGHCRATGSRVEFLVGRTRHAGSCVRHPQYNDRLLNNDISLCKVSPRINLPVFGDLSPVNVRNGDDVTMQGFGRDKLGTLQVGESRISEIRTNQLGTNSRVRLGGGDSGGAMFAGTPDLFRGPFRVIGVNSFIITGTNKSFVARTNTRAAQDFFKDFARRNSVEICGVNSRCDIGNTSDVCEAERDIVRFFEDEIENAKEVLRQCLASQN